MPKSILTVFFLSVAAGLSCLPYAAEPPTAQAAADFEAAFAAGQSNLESGASTSSALGILQKSADQLAQEFGAPGVRFLKRKAVAESDVARRLALTTLARLARARPAGDAFRELLLSKDAALQRAAVDAMSFMPPSEARVLAMEVLKASDSVPVRTGCIALLGLIGDGATVKVLENLQARDKRAEVQAAIAQAVSQLEHTRNIASAEQRLARVNQALAYLQMRQEKQPYIRMCTSEKAAYFTVADALVRQRGRFELEFLQQQLGARDPLAAAVLAIQVEKAAVPDLMNHATDMTVMGEVARKALGALGRTGSVKAVRALESLLEPGNQQLSRLAAMELMNCGDATTLALLSQLSQDERFAEGARKMFNSAVRVLSQRLERSVRKE